jgi:hypothetical protein
MRRHHRSWLCLWPVEVCVFRMARQLSQQSSVAVFRRLMQAKMQMALTRTKEIFPRVPLVCDVSWEYELLPLTLSTVCYMWNMLVAPTMPEYTPVTPDCIKQVIPSRHLVLGVASSGSIIGAHDVPIEDWERLASALIQRPCDVLALYCALTQTLQARGCVFVTPIRKERRCRGSLTCAERCGRHTCCT